MVELRHLTGGGLCNGVDKLVNSNSSSSINSDSNGWLAGCVYYALYTLHYIRLLLLWIIVDNIHGVYENDPLSWRMMQPQSRYRLGLVGLGIDALVVPDILHTNL